jgi:hypothetical protein
MGEACRGRHDRKRPWLPHVLRCLPLAWRYQPLTANGGGTTWVDPRFATKLGNFMPPEGQSFSAYRVGYEEGRLFSYALTLYNEGPLPVTITSIGEPECRGCTFPLVFERSSVAPAGGQYQYDREHATPFDGFVLEPGAFRYVVVETRFDHCESYSADTAVTSLSIRVRYRTGFVDHDVRLLCHTASRCHSSVRNVREGCRRLPSGTSCRRRTSSAPPDCRS